MNWQIRTDIYTMSCVKETANGALPYGTGSSAQYSAMSSVGGMGRARRCVYTYG